jgi:hypothetical protein
MKITQPGTVHVGPDGWIKVEGFEFDYTVDSHIAGCRTAVLLACAWAINELSRELGKTVEEPGGGNIAID